MEEWKEYKLKDLLLIPIRNGLTKPSAIRGKGVRMIGMKEIFSMDFIRSVEMERVPVTEREYESSAIQNNDLLFARQSLSLEGAGKCAIVLCVDEPTVFESHLIRLRVDSSKSNPFFIYYYFKSDIGRNQIKSLVQQVAAAGIRGKELVELGITIPSLDFQNRIVGVLQSLDDKIEVNKRINDNLEQQAQALFKSWFVDFEPFKDGEFVESELGMIPKGWRVGTLGDICSQSSEKVGNRKDVKVMSPVTTGNLMLSEEYFTKQVFSESIAKYKVVRIGAFAFNPARVNIGSLGRNEFDIDGCVSPVYVVFECKNGYEHFFDLFRATERFKTEVLSRAIGGVRQSLNYSDFAMIKTVLAPKEIVMKFNPLIEIIKGVQKHNNKENERLAELRDTLLPRLMSGELKVNEIEKSI